MFSFSLPPSFSPLPACALEQQLLPSVQELKCPPADMADEDLIFRMEGIDNARLTEVTSGNYLDADSDDEDNYYICPITDDPVSNKSASSKVDNYYSNLAKTEQYSSSSSPRNSFNYRVSTGCSLQ